MIMMTIVGCVEEAWRGFSVWSVIGTPLRSREPLLGGVPLEAFSALFGDVGPSWLMLAQNWPIHVYDYGCGPVCDYVCGHVYDYECGHES